MLEWSGEPWIPGDSEFREPHVQHLRREPLELVLGNVELLQSREVDDLGRYGGKCVRTWTNMAVRLCNERYQGGDGAGTNVGVTMGSRADP